MGMTHTYGNWGSFLSALFFSGGSNVAHCPVYGRTADRTAGVRPFFKKNPHLLKSVLADFLPLPKGTKIHSIDLIDAEENASKATIPEGKKFILDIKIRLVRTGREESQAEIINVEMQSINQEYFLDRIFAYSARIYSGQIIRGDDYDKLAPVYSLVFTTFQWLFKTSKH